ncbi:hypothetical protein ABZ341_24215 [Streptomyces sp. NPDC006173]|uniref:hypothetical protein n=1 Tax=Streptomyces sp. NPDC006173 TaxID=3155349 RepID=UPI0033CB879B
MDQDLRPFPHTPDRWDTKQAHALRTGHPLSADCSTECVPVLVMENARWGWLAWTVPSDGSLPKIPYQIGVIAPGTGHIPRSVLRWMGQRTVRRITLAPALPVVRRSAVCALVVSLLVGLLAIRAGLAVDVAVPGMALIPLLSERLEAALEAEEAARVRRVQGEAACRYVGRLAALEDQLVGLALHGGQHEVRRAAEIGHGLLWDVAALLLDRDTRSVSSALIAREVLMLQLVDEAAKFTGLTAADAHR